MKPGSPYKTLTGDAPTTMGPDEPPRVGRKRVAKSYAERAVAGRPCVLPADYKAPTPAQARTAMAMAALVLNGHASPAQAEEAKRTLNAMLPKDMDLHLLIELGRPQLAR